MTRILTIVVLAAFGGAAFAALPALTDEQKAKAAEASARTAWSNKVADYQLCRSMDGVAAQYLKEQKAKGKDLKPVETKPCVDPGPFAVAGAPAVAPAAAAAAPAPAPAATAAAKPAAAPAAKK
jgi:hypothetical protein